MSHDRRCTRTSTACQCSTSTALPSANLDVMVVDHLDVVYIRIGWKCIVFFKDRTLCCYWCFSNIVNENLSMRYTEKNGTNSNCFTIYIEVHIDYFVHFYINRNILAIKEWVPHVYSYLGNHTIINGQCRFHDPC